MKDYSTFFGHKDETWQQAIDRYISFTETDMKDFFGGTNSYFFKDNPMYVYHQGDKYSIEYLKEFEKNHKLHVPLDLVDLLSIHGSFSIGNNIFEIFSQEKGLTFLASALDMYNFNNVIDETSTSMLESLDQYYYFFGVTFPQSDEISFLFADRGAHFGKMYMHVNNLDITLKKTLPDMFKGKNDYMSLNNLISNQIDRVITNALIVKDFIQID